MMIPAVGFPILLLASLFLAIPIMVGIYVYKDATNRNMNATLWTLISVLAPGLIGFIIYLVVRSDYSNLQCPNCNLSITEQYSSCPNCGEPLKAKCSNCSRTLEPNWKVCPDCGTPVSEDQMMPILHQSKDNGLGKILIAVILIPLLIMGVLMIGLTSFRNGFSGSISAVDGMQVEDFKNNPTISTWLKESDAAGNGIYVLEYQRPLNNSGVDSNYIIYRKGLTNEVDIATEGQPKSLFSEGKLVVKYNDIGGKGSQDYNLYQIAYSTSDKPKIEIFIDGKPAGFKTTQTNEPIPFVQQVPMENRAAKLFDARIDYVGDNSGVIKLIEETDLPDLGKYTLELMTAQSPLGVKIFYASPISDSKEFSFSISSVQLLGLIKNLDYVEITDGTYSYKLTSAEATAKLGFDVKELGSAQDVLEKYLSDIRY